MPTEKRTTQYLFIATTVVVLTLLGYFLYRLWLSGNGTLTGEGLDDAVPGPIVPGGRVLPSGSSPLAVATPSPSDNTPVGAEQVLFKLADFSVLGPMLTPAEDAVVFYQKNGGDLYKTNIRGGGAGQTSNITIVGITEVIWSPSRERAAVFYLEEDNLRAFLHKGTSSTSALPTNIQSFAWSPDGKEMAYLLRNGDQAALVIANQNGSNAKTVARVPLLDGRLTWTSPSSMVIQTAPSATVPGSVFVFSRSTGQLKRVIGPKNGLVAAWSPAGEHVLVTSTDARTHAVYTEVFSGNGRMERSALRLDVLPGKCLWSSGREVICAIPKSVPPDAVLPDDYLRGDLTTADRIVAFDLQKNEARYLLEESGFDITEMLLTKNRDYLVFVNRADGIPWSLKIK